MADRGEEHPTDGEPGRNAGMWLTLSLPLPPRGQRILVVDALRSLGARVVERDGERIVARVPSPGHVPDFLVDVRATLRATTGLVDPELSWRWESHEARADRWLRDLPTRRVSERIVVIPRGAPVPSSGADLVLELEPGGAFGTAEHPTTRSCLRLLEKLVRPGTRIADVGAGSGILSIAAVRLGARRALALEADPHACDTARRNVETNGVAGRVELRRREVGPGDLARMRFFDGIVANLESALISRLLPDMARALAPAGWLILSGVPQAESAAVLGRARAHGLELRGEEIEEGWWTGHLAHAG
jgi:ribosomal protein L11 methyltransferase